jgi:hypothetical protein
MMSASFLSHVGIAFLAVAPTSGPTHAWIADIKARRSALLGQEVRIEGEVVDVRSTSPTARRGFYRLTDASDPVGVLVRTEQVPIDGGSFRLRAKVAQDQIVAGALLLDEVDRDRTDARPLLPVVAVLASGLALALLVVLFRRAHLAERRYAVAPPLWLMPDAGPYGKGLAGSGPVQPQLKYDPDLEETDRLQRDRLKWRKRRLLQATIGSLMLTGLSTAWVLGTKSVAGQVPAFIFIDSADPSVTTVRSPGAPADTTQAVPGAPIGGDSALAATAPVRADSAREPRNSTALALTPPRARPPAAQPASRAPDSAPARRDTARRDVAVEPAVPSPSPAPSPAPAPAPPPPPPPAETPAPVRDPEAERARAQSRLDEAAARLVAAINAKRETDVALMLPEAMAGDLGRRERFLKLIRDFGPRASLGGVEPATVTDDRGEARLSIAFAWRGDFGVDKKKTGRLQAVARRDGADWRFEGARLLDAIP